jgi:hypothetical protein
VYTKQYAPDSIPTERFGDYSCSGDVRTSAQEEGSRGSIEGSRGSIEGSRRISDSFIWVLATLQKYFVTALAVFFSCRPIIIELENYCGFLLL